MKYVCEVTGKQFYCPEECKEYEAKATCASLLTERIGRVTDEGWSPGYIGEINQWENVDKMELYKICRGHFEQYEGLEPID